MPSFLRESSSIVDVIEYHWSIDTAFRPANNKLRGPMIVNPDLGLQNSFTGHDIEGARVAVSHFHNLCVTLAL